MDDAGFPKNSTSSMKPISLVGRHCYPFFRDHLHNPYPTSQEKESIVSKANSPDVTMVSVSNWFANSRRRSGWIELCNEYYNGDTKLMVEICSHAIINRGKLRDNDPPGLVDKILDMERKVRSWHEGEAEPGSLAVALCDLIVKFETRLKLITKKKSSEIQPPVSTPPTSSVDRDEDQETHSVVGVKRSHKDYMLGSYASDILPRSISISSASSISSLSSEYYSSDEEERLVKRGRTNTRHTEDKRFTKNLNEKQHKRPDSFQPKGVKRRFSATSFHEDSDSRRTGKRFRCADVVSEPMESSNELLIQNVWPSIQALPDGNFQHTIPSTELDLSFLSTVDLQPPDSSWPLDINLYDWTSSPDILAMMGSNIQSDRDDSFPPFTTTVTKDKTDDSDQWLRSFLTINPSASETEDLSPIQSQAKSGQIPSATEISNYLTTSIPLTFTLDDTALQNSDIPWSAGDQPIFAPISSDVREEIQFDLHTSQGNTLWLLSGSESDPFPPDFPDTLLLDSSCIALADTTSSLQSA